MNNNIKLIVKEFEKKMRVDYYLAKKCKNISRNKIKNLILKNFLKINGNIINEPSLNIKEGDVIEFTIVEEKEISLKPFNYKLDIVFEDNDIIVLNKNSGISIHPGAGNLDKTIVNALIKHAGASLSNIGEKFRPGIVHRIDKDTSGLIVIAKNNFSHMHLSGQFKNHSVDRVYLTMLWGKLRPQSGRIENYIKRSSKNRQLMEVSELKGKKAITNYKTIEIFEGKKKPTLSLVECKLETGRTHQIRVHMNHKGNNILGDKQYKKKFKNIKNVDEEINFLLKNLNRQFLHSKTLGFIHPKTKNRMHFNSKLPYELDNIVKKLRNT